MYSLFYPFKTFILSCMHDTSVYLSWYSAQHSWAITHNTVGRPTPLGSNAQPSTFVFKLLQRVSLTVAARSRHTHSRPILLSCAQQYKHINKRDWRICDILLFYAAMGAVSIKMPILVIVAFNVSPAEKAFAVCQ